MAREVIELVRDDLDGSEDATPVVFAVDGIAYEIDLSDKNAEKLRAALAKYIPVARKLGRVTVGAKAPRAIDQKAFNTRVRKWARAEKKKISGRGRIPQELVDEYLAAGGK